MSGTRLRRITLLDIARKCKPVIVVANLDRLFRSVADAARKIVDFDRMPLSSIETVHAAGQCPPPLSGVGISGNTTGNSMLRSSHSSRVRHSTCASAPSTAITHGCEHLRTSLEVKHFALQHDPASARREGGLEAKMGL
jgi:hypothetical protein